MKRSANAKWEGSLEEGQGTFAVASGAIKAMPYSFKTRFEGTPPSGRGAAGIPPASSTAEASASDPLEGVVEGIGPGGTFGDNVEIAIVAKDKAEADRAFALLGEGGKVSMPLANAPWGPYFGMCKDRFGVNWMVSLPHPV